MLAVNINRTSQSPPRKHPSKLKLIYLIFAKLITRFPECRIMKSRGNVQQVSEPPKSNSITHLPTVNHFCKSNKPPSKQLSYFNELRAEQERRLIYRARIYKLKALAAAAKWKLYRIREARLRAQLHRCVMKIGRAKSKTSPQVATTMAQNVKYVCQIFFIYSANMLATARYSSARSEPVQCVRNATRYFTDTLDREGNAVKHAL